MTRTVAQWVETFSQYEKEFKKWEGRVKKILDRYKDETRSGQGTRGYTEARFNILWSNVQTIVPAVYARVPKPDVSRRFKDNDPVGRVASLMLERALEFEVDHYPDYRSAMKLSVMDRFLGGRGVAWIRYEPHMAYEAVGEPVQGEQITEDADEPAQVEVLDYECAPVDYVNWKDFGHEVARIWEEVGSVWRWVYMKRPALVEAFGEEIGNKIPLDTKPDEMKKNQWGDTGDYEARVAEVWDKTSGKILWIHKSMPKVLKEEDDKLEAEGFFPCPKPLYSTLTSDSLVPTPDFTLYQDQANLLDLLCDRIDGLVKALQVKGVYNAEFKELARLFTEGDNNTLIPVKNWQAFAEKQGLSGAIDLVDITPIAKALVDSYTAMEQIKSQVYEITGLSDIVRGQGEASETATAQRIKGQYASLRLKSMQQEVAEFAAGLMQLKAQVITKFFSEDTIVKISAAQQLSPEDREHIPAALQLLKSGDLSSFRIEIAVDSLVMIDEEADKESRMEFLTATSAFLEKAVPAVQQAPQLAPLLMGLMEFGVRSFKVGKSIEGLFDQTAEQIKQAAANPPPAPPNPDMIKAQSAQQVAQIKAQGDAQTQQQEAQLEQQRMAAEQQHQQQEAQRQMMVDRMNAMLEQQNQDAERRFQDAMEQMRLQAEAAQAAAERNFQLLLQDRKDATTLEVAELGAQTTLDAAKVGAANKAASGQ